MSNRVNGVAFALACSAALAACGDGGGELRVGTYNAGLAVGFVDYADARAPVVTEALVAQELDAVCVQEYWLEEHWNGLTAASSEQWPHTLRLPPDPGMGAACEEGDLDPLAACVMESCADAGPDELTDCALANCGEEVGALSSDCLMCVTSNVGSGSLMEVQETCESGAGASFAYEGSFGIGLLSSIPFEDTDTLVLESSVNRRGVLYGRLADTPLGEVHLFCTHLTANLSSVPYNGDFGSWEDEQAQQIDEVVSWVEAKTGGTGTVVFAGDLNSGPSTDGIREELPANYQKWLDAGFSNPYASAPDVQCTFCDDNPLNEGTMGGDGGLIDHLLLQRFDGDVEYEQMLRGTIDLEVEGMTVTTAYSDHYGLAATLR